MTTISSETSGEEVAAATSIHSLGIQPTRTFDVATAPSGSYATVSTWNDRQGRFTRLRLGYWTGSSGFGYTKVKNYHNLTVAALKATTKNYTSHWVESGPTRVYLAPVNHISCSGWWIFRKCKVIETTVVRLIHSNRTLSDGGYFGVVTAYCSGYTRCPDWVKNAANVS